MTVGAVTVILTVWFSNSHFNGWVHINSHLTEPNHLRNMQVLMECHFTNIEPNRQVPDDLGPLPASGTFHAYYTSKSGTYRRLEVVMPTIRPNRGPTVVSKQLCLLYVQIGDLPSSRSSYAYYTSKSGTLPSSRSSYAYYTSKSGTYRRLEAVMPTILPSRGPYRRLEAVMPTIRPSRGPYHRCGFLDPAIGKLMEDDVAFWRSNVANIMGSSI